MTISKNFVILRDWYRKDSIIISLIQFIIGVIKIRARIYQSGLRRGRNNNTPKRDKEIEIKSEKGRRLLLT